MSFSSHTKIGLLLVCLGWLLPGLVGHVPWKGADGEQFAALLWAWHSNEWLIPTVAGSIDLSSGPLYTWLAGLFSLILSPFMPMHDAARLASGLCVALAAWMLAKTAYRLYGEEAGWAAALMLFGSLGLLLPAHNMDSHMVQLAGMSAVLYGLADMPTSPRRGGTIAGLGLAAMGLSTGWLEPISLLPLVVALPAMIPEYRTAEARRGGAYLLFFSLVPLGLWLAVLYLQQGHLLAAWWRETGQRLVFLATSHVGYQPGYILKNLIWTTWPAWPVALWAIYKARKNISTRAILMPLLVLVFPGIALSLTLHPDEVSMTPLMPPIGLLAGAGLLTLRRGAAYALLWFGAMLFSLFIVVFWAYYSAWQFGVPSELAHKLIRLGVSQSNARNYWALASGILITFSWFILTPQIRRSAIRPMLIWVLGMSIVWLLVTLLMLNELDRRLGYQEMASSVSRIVGKSECVVTRGVPPTQRALLNYHTGIEFTPIKTNCNWMMVYTKRSGAPVQNKPWIRKWDGSRPGDKNEHFWLYQKAGKGSLH